MEWARSHPQAWRTMMSRPRTTAQSRLSTTRDTPPIELDGYSQPPSYEQAVDWVSALPELDLLGKELEYVESFDLDTIIALDDPLQGDFHSQMPLGSETNNMQHGLSPPSSFAPQMQDLLDDQGQQQHDEHNSNLSISEPAWESSSSASVFNRGSLTNTRPRRRSVSTSSRRRLARSSQASFSLSPFSIDQQMIARSSSLTTSQNLLNIYHDVLEHNLSCWVTETTCPYRIGPCHDEANVVPEWGSSWSNRIYQRTVKLDRFAQRCQIVDLTPSENQAASKALNLVIMAFATQWAQGSHRHHQRYGTSSLQPASLADEFDRTMQQYVWHQAQQTLEEVASVDSYRVTWAEMIFGLTQKPWTMVDEDDDADYSDGFYSVQRAARNGSHHDPLRTASLASQVGKIMRKEGPPMYMERAARKMQALKYRCDAIDRGLVQTHTTGQEAEAPTHRTFAMYREDRDTIGLLYWLAIMFDTISSSMNERPVVVLDEDCQYKEARQDTRQDTRTAFDEDSPTQQGRWDCNAFMRGQTESTQQTHWPCSYEAAADDITRSAPVKIFFFRHISYLQNGIRKGVSKEQLEETINSTRSLYIYWNRTHGAFFKQLVQNYSTVPQRIQGWFVCISAHWHLAGLMFADLVDLIDENGVSPPSAARSRSASSMATRIREDSARELSDLARVATPSAMDDAMGTRQMPDFHDAVNEGTILMEPWTMLLIRAFTKASIIFLTKAEDSVRHGRTDLGCNNDDLECNIQRAQDCIKGLWLLGKKSDMARKIAEVLLIAAGRLQNVDNETCTAGTGLAWM